MIFCKVGTMRGLSAAELVKGLPEELREGMELCDTFSSALIAAREYGEVVLVAGSIFLVGEARAELLDKEFLASAQ
jgi:folylpolyglutamate synthase/dihydropteroate synthase